jgi:outer membrane lipoprotein-sorting protein
MSRCSIALGLLISLGLAAVAASAQEGKRNQPTGSIAGGTGQEAGKKQVELVRRVNAYFNQLASLKGTFLQTGADKQRLRGHYYISRPGRFRFEFNRPSRVVILSDGRYVAIQDHDLNTDDRWELSYTPFRALLQRDVDLLRDTRILEAQETEDSITIAFEDKSADTYGRVELLMASKPALRLKGWITKDAQGLDTRIDLVDMQPCEEPDKKLFDPALKLERQR